MKTTVLALFFMAAAASVPAAAQTAPPYTLENTEVRDLRATALKRDYQVFVALPDSYREGTRSYPVLFVTDANYAFPLVRSITQRLTKHAGMEETIVVGLSYAKGDTGVYSRRRDYTPTVPRKHDYRSDMPGRPLALGEAPAYARFLTDQVLPLIAKHYRADMKRKFFVGHSYGSLLGLQILFDKPRTFEYYILGSPSLWYDGGVMFNRLEVYGERHRDLQANVFFGIGSREGLAPGKKRARDEENADMVADLRDFDKALKAQRYPNLRTQVKVFADEDHASVFPLVLTHGLRAVLPTKK
ncbi:alpha/beta hydrolase [Massilia sp. Mn16-1_5]|uniref:alpha/beta hydrolase n=1 Tax=Massilia sp. Mn16-1_5 TaxID=2079199 RepID=UPI001E4FDB66|nr:alpha/beta hydrolase-fold protein [Massilia sp. Mn16-1_5]